MFQIETKALGSARATLRLRIPSSTEHDSIARKRKHLVLVGQRFGYEYLRALSAEQDSIASVNNLFKAKVEPNGY